MKASYNDVIIYSGVVYSHNYCIIALLLYGLQEKKLCKVCS